MRSSLRRLLLLFLLIVVAVGLWFGLRKRDNAPVLKELDIVEAPDHYGLPFAERQEIKGGHPLAAELNARENPPQRDLEILREMLLAFTTSLKEPNRPPLGDNQDITAALTGHNRAKQIVIPANHPSIDEKGRLLDRWGTPFHFHARSADSFDLRSAGPDRILFTPDDVTWSPR